MSDSRIHDRPLSTHSLPDRQRIDEVADRFEAALRGGQPAKIADFLDEVGGEPRRQLLCALVVVDLKVRWDSGERRRIEAYLADWSELRRDAAALVELLRFECALRQQHGDNPTPDELRERFPDLDLARLEAELLPQLKTSRHERPITGPKVTAG